MPRCLLLFGLIFFASAAVAVDDNTDLQRERRHGDRLLEQYLWTVALENDLLAGGHKDKDYTYGLNVTYSGPDASKSALSLYPLQRYFDRLIPDIDGVENHSLEFGFYGFTPDATSSREAIYDDRPYASLVYLQSNREVVDVGRGIGWTSSLSLGVLGLDLVGSSQNRMHQLTNSRPAKGWEHQISDGGELTAKYALAYQKFWFQDEPSLELKSTSQASIGYLTEVSYGLSFRAGDIRSSWWSFDPELAAYGERSGLTSSGTVGEHYLWGGFALKARAYNVFLQGQFRDSEVSFDGDQLRHLLVEGWLGYTVGFSNGYRVSYWLRGHSSEIRDGAGDRGLLWGGLIVSRSF